MSEPQITLIVMNRCDYADLCRWAVHTPCDLASLARVPLLLTQKGEGWFFGAFN